MDPNAAWESIVAPTSTLVWGSHVHAQHSTQSPSAKGACGQGRVWPRACVAKGVCAMRPQHEAQPRPRRSPGAAQAVAGRLIWVRYAHPYIYAASARGADEQRSEHAREQIWLQLVQALEEERAEGRPVCASVGRRQGKALRAQ